MVHLKVKLPGGTLKVKSYRYLRTRERERQVPVMKMGQIYLCWWRNGSDKKTRRDNPAGEQA